jgi:hypothetical protein
VNFEKNDQCGIAKQVYLAQANHFIQRAVTHQGAPDDFQCLKRMDCKGLKKTVARSGHTTLYLRQ